MGFSELGPLYCIGTFTGDDKNIARARYMYRFLMDASLPSVAPLYTVIILIPS